MKHRSMVIVSAVIAAALSPAAHAADAGADYPNRSKNIETCKHNYLPGGR